MDDFGIYPSGDILCDWEIQAEKMDLPAYGRHSRSGCLANHVARNAAIHGAKRVIDALRKQSVSYDIHEKAHDAWLADVNDEDCASHQAFTLIALQESERELEQLIAFVEAQ